MLRAIKRVYKILVIIVTVGAITDALEKALKPTTTKYPRIILRDERTPKVRKTISTEADPITLRTALREQLDGIARCEDWCIDPHCRGECVPVGCYCQDGDTRGFCGSRCRKMFESDMENQMLAQLQGEQQSEWRAVQNETAHYEEGPAHTRHGGIDMDDRDRWGYDEEPF